GQCAGAAVGAGRLRRGTEVDHRRPRPLQPGFQPLRSGAAAGAAGAGGGLRTAPRGRLSARDGAFAGRAAGRRDTRPAPGRGRVRGAGDAGDPARRSARVASGAQLRAARDPPGPDAGDRAAGLAGPAVSAHRLGAGAANPCRTGHLRWILHPALAFATDLLRGAVVGVRPGLYRVRGDRPGLLVALATTAPAGASRTRGLTRKR